MVWLKSSLRNFRIDFKVHRSRSFAANRKIFEGVNEKLGFHVLEVYIKDQQLILTYKILAIFALTILQVMRFALHVS